MQNVQGGGNSMNVSSEINITHRELCIATAKRFNDKFALYEYKGTASREEPDVLVFGFGGTMLFEIKVSLADFNADKKKQVRKKYILRWHLDYLDRMFRENPANYDKRIHRQFFKLRRDHPSLFYIQNDRLGNRRYYVCPWGLIPVEKIPDGWGLYYFKNGKFFLKKESAQFRSNLRTENNLAIHALRRYASGDNTGILINTYGDKA
jgi:hypothetical protein